MSKKKKYAQRTPLSVRGGIRAQGVLGGRMRPWWSLRWTAFLEASRLGARLGRGRNYAISGQVSSLTLSEGCVTANVQGSQREPYTGTISFPCATGDARSRILRALRLKPMWIARLMTGDLPYEVNALFEAEGVPLIPHQTKDLHSRCSCPDWANPCKHLAAVYCLLGETLSKNPLFLLELHGIRRCDLAADAAVPAAPSDAPAAACVPLETEAAAAAFYGRPLPEFSDFGDAPKSALPAPLIHRLGPLPFWRGQERFVDTLEHLYIRAATRGWTVWTGEPLDLRREDEKIVVAGANLHLRQNRLRVDTSFA
jgi:uncharacterized Zn finger protein